MPAPYFSETDKAREIIDPKYLQGRGIDVGCASHKITPDAIGIDGRQLEGVDCVTDDIYNISQIIGLQGVDFLYSSHLIEHLRNPTAAIEDWAKLIKQGGYLILYLPDKRGYSNEGNPEHIFDWDYHSFMFYFTRAFCGVGKNFKGNNFTPIFEIVESKEDFREDCYSFLIIARKL